MSESKKPLITGFLVSPPKKDKESYMDHMQLITANDVSDTPELAWQKFCYPSLIRSAYENDGFKAVKVSIYLEE